MGGNAVPSDRGQVEFAPEPASHLWVAACLAVGAGAVAACLMLGGGELVLSVKRFVLEAIYFGSQ